MPINGDSDGSVNSASGTFLSRLLAVLKEQLWATCGATGPGSPVFRLSRNG